LQARFGVGGCGLVRAKDAGSPLNGYPFSEKNGCKFQDASCKQRPGQRFEDRCRKIKSDRSAVEWLPFSEKNGCKFKDASCKEKKKTFF